MWTYYILVNLFLMSRKTANWTPKAMKEPTMEAKKVCSEIPVLVWALPAPESSALPMLVGCAISVEDEDAMVIGVAEELGRYGTGRPLQALVRVDLLVFASRAVYCGNMFRQSLYGWLVKVTGMVHGKVYRCGSEIIPHQINKC